MSADEGTVAVIYCRVSTDDKDQTNSTQERVCREFCEKNGITVLEVYSDEITGTTLDRPGFSRMMTRILFQKDADFVVAYDQSRITRGTDFDEIKTTLQSCRCRFRFVRMDLDSDTLPGQIVQDIMSRVNTNENKVRNERTKLGMETRKIEGIHVGRPAVFMFAEDIETAPKGRYKPGVTKAYHEDTIMGYARQGYSLFVLARDIIGVSYQSLVCEMRPRDPNDPHCRFKGTRDRYTPYMAVLQQCREQRKGCTAERVGNPEEITAERVVA